MSRWLAIAALSLALPLAASAGELAVPHVPSANPNWTPVPPKEGYSYPDCYCTDSDGMRVEVGETACLHIGSRQMLARCDMSVNNTTWRPIGEGCPAV